MSDNTFQSTLSAMVAKQMAHATPEQAAEVLEGLLRCAGTTIAIMSNGDGKTIQNLAMGADSYLIETATTMAPFGAFMGGQER